MVPISQLQVDPLFRIDDQFVKLQVKLSRGEIKVSLTRLPEAEIMSGFYRRVAGNTEHVSNLANLDRVPMIASSIRGGWRPSVEVYWSPLAPVGGCYVCPDDELILAAYRALNIRLVPTRILKPKASPLTEGSVWIEERNGGVGLAREFPPLRSDNYQALSIGGSASFEEACGILTNACASVGETIRNFHSDECESNLHYHQMLHAAVGRHRRIIGSIAKLVAENRTEHAGALARVCYEAFLNFYVDWLAPEFLGSRLQLLGIIRVNRMDEKELRPLRNFKELFENTFRKARLSPLGEQFHEALYPALSLIAHQSYFYLEREATGFGEVAFDDFDSINQKMVIWLNALTTAFLMRVGNDVGHEWKITPS